MIDTGTGDDVRAPFAAFLCDSETMENLAAAVAEQGWTSDAIQSGGIAKAIELMDSLNQPQILIVDVSESQDPLSDMGELAEVCPADIQVIAVGDTNDITLFRDLLDAGVRDYILKPASKALFSASIANTLSSMEDEGEEHTSPLPEGKKVIGVIGARGGVGATSIATSLAWVFSKDLKQTVCLVDFDLYFGTTALTFELEPGRGLVDALESPDRIDNLLIERALIKVNDNLSLMGAEAPLTQPLIIDDESLPKLIEAISETADVVVIDLPGSFAAQHSLLMEYLSDVLVVSELSLASTRDAIRLLALAQDAAPTAKVHVLANKVGSGISIEVPVVDFEASIERKIDWTMPMDEKTMLLATKSAKPMPQAASGSKLAKIILNVANRVAGYTVDIAEKPKKKNLLSFIKGGK